MVSPLGVYISYSNYFYIPSVLSQGMAICYCGHWLSESRTVELNHWKGHCLKEMFDYKTVLIKPLNRPLLLVIYPHPSGAWSLCWPHDTHGIVNRGLNYSNRYLN